MNTYKFFSDPSHGWLEVSRKELEELNLTNCISTYSYQFRDNVYLEEDMDADIFLSMKKNLKQEYNIYYGAECYTDEYSPIRDFDSYTPYIKE